MITLRNCLTFFNLRALLMITKKWSDMSESIRGTLEKINGGIYSKR